MTEKIGTIKNPLTIIAIFAGIAEVSGTIVLPFIAPANQLTFIYFLIIFPSVLVTVFFITLNFNNKALYAPSDFSNEENYIKIFKYDVIKQEKIQVTVSPDELLTILNENITQLKKDNDDKFLRLESEVKILRLKETLEQKEQFEDIDSEEKNEERLVSISNFSNASLLVRKLERKGYSTEIYEPERGLSNFRDHRSIWLGYKVPLKIAKEVILAAKDIYPHLDYIDLSNYGNSDPPLYVHHQIYIGGATSTAEERGLKSLKQKDWDELKEAATLEEFHEVIKRLQ
ncbi:hypothetical protein [Foetidibacter luteolus]|uniref:hypothetical protein n=1 Tax=Foetidibacter luteolus TaxID=2608880 RepID=UPI00129B139A|nr:hypothetical protein [Foetidibacter luteolus]